MRPVVMSATSAAPLAIALALQLVGPNDRPGVVPAVMPPVVTIEQVPELPIAQPKVICPSVVRFAMPAAITRIVHEEAKRAGIDAADFWITAHIESSGDPSNQTGSYKGLYQLSYAEFYRRGGSDIFDARQNARAAAAHFVDQIAGFKDDYGRAPAAVELYLIHQQGEAGLAAHLADPGRLAWRSMASTGEGRAKGDGWSRNAIWWNVPGDVRSRFGSVDNITSAQFVEMWREKFEARRASALKALGLCEVAS